jgi:hypothetical protein
MKALCPATLSAATLLANVVLEMFSGNLSEKSLSLTQDVRFVTHGTLLDLET